MKICSFNKTLINVKKKFTYENEKKNHGKIPFGSSINNFFQKSLLKFLTTCYVY